MKMFYHYKNRPEELESPLSNLGYLIKVLHEIMSQQVEEQMQEFGLTAAQWHPLIIIDLQQADTPAQVARLINVDTGATTRILDRLEQKGFITRSRSTQDRRVVHLHLTEKGAKVTKKLMPVVEQILNQALQGFTQEEFELYKKLTMRMLVNLNPEEIERIRRDTSRLCCKKADA